MLKKILPVIIITVCLLFAGCKAPADQEQKNNTETAVLSTETQEEDWKQVHSTQKDLEKLPQKIQKIFSDNQTFFDVEKGKEYDKNSFIKTLTKEGYRPQVDEDLDTNSCKILPLLLQPVVENAILHGLESKTEDGMITIQIASADATLLITIKDNGQGMTNEELDALRDRIRNHPSSDTHSIGLYNIKQRISLFYGEGYYMEIDSAIGAGTTVRLKIPKTI